MRILHTSDWHLGQTLHEVSREDEHRRFLAWLLDTLAAEQADALIVAGDVFDNANPFSSAQRMYYRFLTDCRARFPQLDVIIVGGNHDSPSRLDAPADLLDAFGVTVVGGVPRTTDGRTVDVERFVVPLTPRDRAGDDADAELAEIRLVEPFETRRHFVPRTGGQAFDELHVVAAEIQQHRFLQPFVDLPAVAGRAPPRALRPIPATTSPRSSTAGRTSTRRFRSRSGVASTLEGVLDGARNCASGFDASTGGSGLSMRCFSFGAGHQGTAQ